MPVLAHLLVPKAPEQGSRLMGPICSSEMAQKSRGSQLTKTHIAMSALGMEGNSFYIFPSLPFFLPSRLPTYLHCQAVENKDVVVVL